MSDQPKLSYDPNALPKPVTNHDFYLQASVVEARALRAAVNALNATLQTLVDALTPQKAVEEDKPKKAK